MGNWIDGGYKKGERVTTTEGVKCILTVSLGSLGWVAKEVKTGRKIILMFCSDEYKRRMRKNESKYKRVRASQSRHSG